MKFLKWLGIILLLLIVVYFLGPKPAMPKLSDDLPEVPSKSAELEKFIHDQEAQHKLKPDNEARIVWFNDSLKEPTEYAIVYIHGFSASQKDGDPIHYTLAKKFGCNLFLNRLEDHGIDTTECLLNVTADRLWNSAKEAYAIGKRLGKKVILLSTSTGGTLALKLAAEYPDIAGLILLSPNIAINDPNAWVANNHWGLQIAKLIAGNYILSKDSAIPLYTQYWYAKYRVESVVQLEELIETTMKESTFKKITQPVLLLYYYKDEDHQDKVVKVSAMKRMFMQLGTSENLKWQEAVPNAGEHPIGSSLRSKDVQTVEEDCEKFAMEILKLSPVQN